MNLRRRIHACHMRRRIHARAERRGSMKEIETDKTKGAIRKYRANGRGKHSPLHLKRLTYTYTWRKTGEVCVHVNVNVREGGKCVCM